VKRRAEIARDGLLLLLLAAGAYYVGHGAWIEAKALLAQQLLEGSWERALAGETRAAPWPWADTWPVARLSFPRQRGSLLVLSGDSGRTMAFGPGHAPGSALPGTAGTAIISGHRDTHFAVLRELAVGDALRVERSDGVTVRYRVSEVAVVDARTDSLRAPPDRAALVLVTCWPFDALSPGGPLRYVVTADREKPRPAGPA
jgi:sortase A